MTSIAHNTMTLGYDLEDGPPLSAEGSLFVPEPFKVRWIRIVMIDRDLAGTPRDCRECPVSKAILRYSKLGTIVESTNTNITFSWANKKIGYRVPTPSLASDFIENFDSVYGDPDDEFDRRGRPGEFDILFPVEFLSGRIRT